MIRKLLFSLALTSCYLAATAQVDLRCGGTLVGHNVTAGKQMPEALQALLGERLKSLAATPSAHQPAPPAQRQRRLMVPAPRKRIDPLLKSISGQEAPYNLLAPYYRYTSGQISDERCLAGCVATSIEQILAYYRYPDELTDTLKGWTTENYTIDDLLPGTRFDWDNHLTDYRNGWTDLQGMAVALPMLAAGMAVKMRYTPGSSGANTSDAVEPLKRAFGYGMARWHDRILYSPARWHALIQHELEQGRPIAYVGHNMEMKGHAFNIDGIDEQGYYHINWAYEGYYDGWFDLDWLCPWEQYDIIPNSIAYGFFCNQGALFLHPSADAQPLDADSLDIDNLAVELTKLQLLREPDTQGYTPADITFENHSADDVTYTYEVFTNLPTDTSLFEQADYVGLSAINVPAKGSATQRVYLMFHREGQRTLSISHDDVTIPYSTPVSVAVGKEAALEWNNLTYELENDGSNSTEATLTAHFTIDVNNVSPDIYGSSIILYCLYAEGNENEDTRHFAIIDLPPGESQTMDVRFSHLQYATRYHFLLRSPWTIRQTLEFETPAPTAISLPQTQKHDTRAYDIGGRMWNANRSDIMIKGGRKWLTR